MPTNPINLIIPTNPTFCTKKTEILCYNKVQPQKILRNIRFIIYYLLISKLPNNNAKDYF